LTTTGLYDLAVVQGTVTLNPGTYLFAFTGTATGVDLAVNGPYENSMFYFSTSSTSSSGALPSTVTVATSATMSTSSWGVDFTPVFLLH
jgi:hypothetical protein